MATTSNVGLALGKVWHLVDAKDKVLGKVAQRIAIALRGKYKPTYNPAGKVEWQVERLVDSGDYVVVINARHASLSGNKATEKLYRWHTQYPGGLKEVKYNEFVKKHPTAPLEKAVYGMLPKNNLRKVWMSRLRVYPDDKHPHKRNILKDHSLQYESKIEELFAQVKSTPPSS